MFFFFFSQFSASLPLSRHHLSLSDSRNEETGRREGSGEEKEKKGKRKRKRVRGCCCA
jgi:hypothetical protein